MQYLSLHKKSPSAGFKEAVLQGQAPDGGLYYPESIPRMPEAFIQNIGDYSNEAIAYEVVRPFVGNEIAKAELEKLAGESIAFPIPLVQVNEHIHFLELFHGPTLAFKDVGARFMSRCLSILNRNESDKTIVLVATSGDTGGAVAGGFHHVEGIEVVILYPSGKVSSVQEKQLTAMGGNIRALEVNGNFDDCQILVKQAFADMELRQQRKLCSANSINIARWLPQQIYYWLAWKQWPAKERPPVISVPSGNFGNIGAGMLAFKTGLPVAHFIAACNANDVVPRYLESGAYSPRETIATISNAMDVGNPSNFVRIEALFDQDMSGIKQMLSATRVTDELTRATIRRLYTEYQYLADPHSAVGFSSLEQYLEEQPGQAGIVVSTAHPVKFPEVTAAETQQTIPIPQQVEALMQSPSQSVKMEVEYAALREVLMGIV